MRYFRLATDCYLIEGEVDAAIYDLSRRRLWLLDDRAHALLRRCEDNHPLPDALPEAEQACLDALQEAGAGYFDDRPAYVDKLLLHQPIEMTGIASAPPAFSRADWAITGACDLGCAFCPAGSGDLAWLGCETCLRRAGGAAAPWVPHDLERFAGELELLGVKVLHLRGGNPLLEWDYLQRIVQAVRGSPLGLLISTPGTGQEPERILALCEGGCVRLNVVLFGIREEATRTVCGAGGAQAQAAPLLDAFAGAGIPCYITFLLTADTRADWPEMSDYAVSRWGIRPRAAEIYRREAPPGGRLRHVGEQVKPLRAWQSAEEFFFRVTANPCAHGRFEIGIDGKVRCCPAFEQVCGDVAGDGLRRALAGDSLYDAWALSKNKIEPCKRCALRYACLDCSAFEIAGQSDPAIKAAYCPYDPEPGPARAWERDWGEPDFVLTWRLPDA